MFYQHDVPMPTLTNFRVTHLRQLEAESIYILREVAADFGRPVLLYSIGKDSSVMLHLASKACRSSLAYGVSSPPPAIPQFVSMLGTRRFDLSKSPLLPILLWRDCGFQPTSD